MKLATLLAAALVGVCAHAAPDGCYQHDLKSCKFSNGIEMEQIECDALRKYFKSNPEPARCSPASIAPQPIKRVDLERCVSSDGLAIPPAACEAMRQRAAEEERELQARSEQLQRLLDSAPKPPPEPPVRLSDIECGSSPTCLADRMAQRREAEDRRQAEIRAQQALDEAADRAEAERQRKAQEKVKAACGDDYRAPRVGMSIERAKQCVAPSLRISGQINRADGIVTTYQTSSGAYFHVMNGVIVAWGR